MNAKHNPMAQTRHEPLATSETESTAGVARDDVLVSALLDGELNETELNDWLSREPDMLDAATHGQTYQFIGEALRGQTSLVAGTSATAFLTNLQTRLRSEVLAEHSPAAAFMPHPPLKAAPERAPAANDAVFRWKLVAGVASLGAVMAVTWSVLGSVPGSAGSGAAASQLALSQPSQEGTPAARTVVAATPATTPLAVNTRQGVLIRDAELEALMAEHRQHGGVSALQMPAGFLRNATFDPDAR